MFVPSETSLNDDPAQGTRLWASLTRRRTSEAILATYERLQAGQFGVSNETRRIRNNAIKPVLGFPSVSSCCDDVHH